MSDLKEKDIEEHPYVKWLEKKLEDVEKEIKEKSEGYAKVCARLHEQVIDLTMKDKELKQKLQQLHNEIIGYFNDFDVVSFLEKNDIKYDAWIKSKMFMLIGEFRDELIMRFSKFEELLKEEKEAKP